MKKNIIFTIKAFVICLVLTFIAWKGFDQYFTLAEQQQTTCSLSKQKHSAAYEWLQQNPNGNFCAWKAQHQNSDLFTWERTNTIDQKWDTTSIVCISIFGLGILMAIFFFLRHAIADEQTKNRILGKKGMERTITLSFYISCITIGLVVNYFKWEPVNNAIIMVFIAAFFTLLIVRIMIFRERLIKSKQSCT
jgi:hypothetical protein